MPDMYLQRFSKFKADLPAVETREYRNLLQCMCMFWLSRSNRLTLRGQDTKIMETPLRLETFAFFVVCVQADGGRYKKCFFWMATSIFKGCSSTIMTTTSSTAQGSGGSFENRKPIGEVGCCESRMAERVHWWTERWLELCFLELLQWLQCSPGRSPHPQLLDLLWCSSAVVVVAV